MYDPQNHMMVGNGGVAGFIRYDEMQVPVNKYGFAVACTVSNLSPVRISLPFEENLFGNICSRLLLSVLICTPGGSLDLRSEKFSPNIGCTGKRGSHLFAPTTLHQSEFKVIGSVRTNGDPSTSASNIG